MTSKHYFLILVASGSLLFQAAQAGEKTIDLEDETARLNYSLGYQIGGDFKRQGVEMDPDAVVAGIADALEGGMPQIPRKDMHAMLVELKQKVVEAERQQRQNTELTLKREGEAFLAENKSRDGIMTTESGLQYRIIDPGTGEPPALTDRITVDYRGTLINGHEFDKGEGVSFSLNGVIRGWTEGLQLIGEGGHIELFIPAKLAYGDRGPLANRALIFDVKLVSIGADS
jgi:FKBP-type peptidyl-prolyl cis-trans isomerase FklB